MDSNDLYETVYDMVDELKEDGYTDTLLGLKSRGMRNADLFCHNQIRSKLVALINKAWVDIEKDNEE